MINNNLHNILVVFLFGDGMSNSAFTLKMLVLNFFLFYLHDCSQNFKFHFDHL